MVFETTSLMARLARAAGWALAIGVVTLAACDVPEAPEWTVGLSVPFSTEPVAIVDFLPDVVDTVHVGGESAFSVEIQQDSVDYTLGEMCPACQALEGTTTTVPSFDYTDSLDVLFPSELVSVELLSARLGLWIFNGLNFDPLRPGAGGHIAIAVRDLGSGALLDSVFVSGDSETLPPGARSELVVDITDSEITQGIRVRVGVHSPSDGQTVTIDNSLTARFGAFLDEIYVQALTAVVDSDTLEETYLVDFDEDLREDIAERVETGAYELKLIHDVEIAGTLEVSIAGSPSDLFSGLTSREVRLFDLTFAPDLRQRGALSVEEIERIAEFPEVYVGYRGTASGSQPGNQSRFTPDQALEAEFRVDADVRVGG